MEEVRELLQRKGTFAWETGVLLEIAEADRAVLVMEAEPRHQNPSGRIHGGALFTLADTAAGLAARSDGRLYVTQNADIHFIRSQSEGLLRAEGMVIHRGRSTCVVRVELTGEDGKLLATAEMTFFCVSPA